jgi:transcriptional antiterminator NusG
MFHLTENFCRFCIRYRFWVIDGPFNDFSGVVEEADNQKGKVKVAVIRFGRSTPVELDFSQIEIG